MSRYSALLCSAATLLACAAQSGLALAQDATAQPASRASSSETVVVTANKYKQNINKVGASVTAASGTQLTKLGVTDTSQLTKIVPGFNFTPSAYGTPVYAIRGVGFQDTSLAASPTVSVYVDEVPLPYSIMTTGASFDLQRVEVLKGPQGTQFGSNATGGAINYIAQKPSDTLEAGATLSYSRFNTVDLQGYISGPISDTLSFRIAARSIQGDDWQYSYTHPDEAGKKDIVEGRAALQWKPTDDFSATLTLSGFQDQSDTQMPQLYGIAVLSPNSALDPRIGVFPFNELGHTVGNTTNPLYGPEGYHYPFAPNNARAADWSPCANVSPFDPPYQTSAGIPPGDPLKPSHSTDCEFPHNDNKLWSASLRMDYDLAPDLTITSLTAYHDFDRYSLIEGDGTIYQDYESLQTGHIKTFYQELRLAGNWWGQGKWQVGGNYEQDKTQDRFLQTYGNSTASPTALPGAILCGGQAACTAAGLNVAGVPDYYLTYLGPTEPTNNQETDTYGAFANFEYPVLDDLTLIGGIRYTKTDKTWNGCGYDGGDGTWSTVSQQIQNLLEVLNNQISLQQYLQPGSKSGGNGINVGPGACATTGPASDGFHPQSFSQEFDENNISWKVGLNWQILPNTLLYATVSQGWKSGAFPTVATSSYAQLAPAKQEGLLAYEVGAKSKIDDTLQLNAAVFYYDYKDKQLLGDILDPVFGALPRLVNVPKSHVIGFEVSGRWEPIDGLVFTPSVSYSFSRVDKCSGGDSSVANNAGPGCHSDGHYWNYDTFQQLSDLNGEQFPDSPEWQADLDGQYEWQVMDNGLSAFVGFNLNYQSSTNNGFYNQLAYIANPAEGTASPNAYPSDILHIRSYYTLDLRVGVENDQWSFQVWGRNVTNQYYWTAADHVNDALVRYAGMPATYGFTLGYKF